MGSDGRWEGESELAYFDGAMEVGEIPQDDDDDNDDDGEEDQKYFCIFSLPFYLPPSLYPHPITYLYVYSNWIRP